MKRKKRPVRKEKELLTKNRLNADNWLVERKNQTNIVFVHRTSGTLRSISVQT